jgi:hypothetical protein
MKPVGVLAIMLAWLAMAGCVSRDVPERASTVPTRSVQEAPADEGRLIVADLLEAHHEAVGQMRVSAALRPQLHANCN